MFNASEHTRLLADVFGIPAAFLHGLFGYSYGSDALVLQPTLPQGVSSLEQLFPVRFGNVTLYLSMSGASRLSTPNPPLRHFSWRCCCRYGAARAGAEAGASADAEAGGAMVVQPVRMHLPRHGGLLYAQRLF